MDPTDREVLALRHFEHLSTAEAARVLGIKETAAGKRYLRALERLREVMDADSRRYGTVTRNIHTNLPQAGKGGGEELSS